VGSPGYRSPWRGFKLCGRGNCVAQVAVQYSHIRMHLTPARRNLGTAPIAELCWDSGAAGS